MQEEEERESCLVKMLRQQGSKEKDYCLFNLLLNLDLHEGEECSSPLLTVSPLIHFCISSLNILCAGSIARGTFFIDCSDIRTSSTV